MNKKTKSNVYLELDTILDTRLAALSVISDKIASEVVSAGEYLNRVKDSFGPISEDIFQFYYRKRNKHLLKVAVPTALLDLIAGYLLEAIAGFHAGKVDKYPKLYINTYPYVLNEEEERNLLAILFTVINIKIDMEVMCVSNQELTPKWIGTNIKIMCKYDALNWIEYHNALGTLAKHPLLTTTILAPTILSCKLKSSDIDEETFHTLGRGLATLAEILFIRMKYFCFRT